MPRKSWPLIILPLFPLGWLAITYIPSTLSKAELANAGPRSLMTEPIAARVLETETIETLMKGERPGVIDEGESAAYSAGVGGELLLVNKSHPLPADYIPPDLRPADIPFNCPADSPKMLMRDEAAKAIERLFAEAEKEDIDLIGVSAYRSYERQQEIFTREVALKGEEAANRVSARPGESEHQSGLAIDVSCHEADERLDETFEATKARQWLSRHAAAFGFIIRYPEGKEGVTGYQYEPWHLRYVGVLNAETIAKAGLTLEEYEMGMTIALNPQTPGNG